MNISNKNAVCLQCRRLGRINFWRRVRICPECGKPMLDIGKRWRIPKRKDKVGWDILIKLVNYALSKGRAPSWYLSSYGLYLLREGKI